MSGSFKCPKCQKSNTSHQWILIRVSADAFLKVCKTCASDHKPAIDTTYYEANKARLEQERKRKNEELRAQIKKGTLVTPPDTWRR